MTSSFAPVPVTKHAEFIAAVPRAMFQTMTPPFPQGSGVFLYPFEQWLEQAQQHLTIAQRKRLEQDPTYRQLLPYLMVTQVIKGVKHYGVYQRTKKVGEARLGGKYSIGFGGHIDFQDIVHEQSVVQLGATISNSAEREEVEEVLTRDQDGNVTDWAPVIQHTDAFILDDSDEVGTVHLGLVCEAFYPNGLTLECKESELKWIGMFPLDALLALEFDFESWSRLVLLHLNDHTLVAPRD